MLINRQNLGVAVGFGSSSSINSSDEMLGCELLPLGRVHSIEDGTLRFRHVTRDERTLRDLIYPIVNRRLRFSDSS